MNMWCFDKKHLESSIKKGNLLLNKKSISGSSKAKILDEISVFERWLNDDFTYPNKYVLINRDSNIKKDFSELKRLIMQDVKICGSSFGNGYISLISRINDNDLFNVQKYFSDSISIDEQADVTLKTYEKYSSKYLLDRARDTILSNKSHIQLINDKKFLSYSYASNKILDENFIVLNPCEGNGILSYYVQEGIEDLIPMGYSFNHLELGPILMELLVHDRLFEEKNIKYSTDYYDLISRLREYLFDILPVLKLFQVIRTLKENEITDEMFIELCNMYFGTDNVIQVYSIVHRLLDDNVIEFIFSTLYAIDARKRVIENGVDVVDALNSTNDDYLYTKDAINYKYLVYQRYMDEIRSRCK